MIEAMKQALYSLEQFGEHYETCPDYVYASGISKCDCGYNKERHALRQAIEQAEKQLDVSLIDEGNKNEPTKYSDIKDFSQRCEEQPDHQSGMITNAMIQMRLMEEIEELRDYIEQAEKQADVSLINEGNKQEPVAWLHPEDDGRIEHNWIWACSMQDAKERIPLYAKPPRKEFQTEQAIRHERDCCRQLVWDYGFSRIDNEDVQAACVTLAEMIMARDEKK